MTLEVLNMSLLESIESQLIYAIYRFLVLCFELMLAERPFELSSPATENCWFSPWWDKEEN